MPANRSFVSGQASSLAIESRLTDGIQSAATTRRHPPMKTSRIASAALLAFSGTAFSQSSVTLYGRLDTGLVIDGGAAAGKSVRLSSGVAKGSLLGFKGVEDLGDGYKAGFQIET